MKVKYYYFSIAIRVKNKSVANQQPRIPPRSRQTRASPNKNTSVGHPIIVNANSRFYLMLDKGLLHTLEKNCLKSTTRRFEVLSFVITLVVSAWP